MGIPNGWTTLRSDDHHATGNRTAQAMSAERRRGDGRSSAGRLLSRRKSVTAARIIVLQPKKIECSDQFPACGSSRAIQPRSGWLCEGTISANDEPPSRCASSTELETLVATVWWSDAYRASPGAS